MPQFCPNIDNQEINLVALPDLKLEQQQKKATPDLAQLIDRAIGDIEDMYY